MPSHQAKVAVIGIGYANCTRKPTREIGVDSVEACRKAIADAGLLPEDIDGITTFPERGDHLAGGVDGVDLVTPRYISAALGLPSVAWSETNGQFIGAAFLEAEHAVASGACRYALVWRSLSFPRGQRYGQMAPEQATGANQFQFPFGYMGAGPLSRAVLYQRYLHKYGATREQMATQIVRNRQNALRNEKGYWANERQETLDKEDYLNSRMVADPFCLYDCDIPVQGCAAWVLTAADRAKDAPNRPAYIVGYDQGIGFRKSGEAGPLEEQQANGALTAKRLWASSGLLPTDMSTANLYDGFSLYVYLWLESLGFCKQGEASAYVQSPELSLGGKFPINTSGGNLGEGRLHGAAHISEAILQAMGRAGERQVTNTHYALAAVGPSAGGQTIIFSSEPQ